MPKIYSQIEKDNIRNTLRREAAKCLGIYGVKRTTVDELVHRAGIPKGTFYLFYENKESLFLDIIDNFLQIIHMWRFDFFYLFCKYKPRCKYNLHYTYNGAIN